MYIEGGGQCFFDILSHHLSEGSGENHRTLWDIRRRYKNRVWDLPNTTSEL